MKDFKKIAKERQVINDAIRQFFAARNYIEVETPIVVRSPGMEPNLTPFETRTIEPDGTVHASGLITSPEYSMKKLLGRGLERIFTITKVFRNEESFGGQHNPEFSMLEWYQQGADYQACIDETRELVEFVSARLISDSGEETKSKFMSMRVRDLFLDHVGVDLDHASEQDLIDACARHEISVDSTDTESDLFYRLFLTLIEPTFHDRNVFVYDYPIYQAALAALTDDKKYGQRFELYMNGLELCNGFTELTDATEQRRRFELEAKERLDAGKNLFPFDEAFLSSLESIKQPSFGNALGIDRMHMALMKRKNIEDVLLFTASDLF